MRERAAVSGGRAGVLRRAQEVGTADASAELARREIGALQEEVLAALKRFGAGGVLLAGAGTCGVLALWAAHETVMRAAESALPRGRAAALLACAYGAGGAALGVAARNRIRAAADATSGALEKEAGALEGDHTHQMPGGPPTES